MKLSDWFRSCTRMVKLGPTRFMKELPERQYAKLTDINANTRDDYDVESRTASDRIAQLEQHIAGLQDNVSAGRQEIERLKAELLLARADATSTINTRGESRSDLPSFASAIGRIVELAHKGDPIAQFYAGISYLFGPEGNSFLGEHWLTKAASSGETNAQVVLGILKWHGIFLERGIQQAFYWLSLARRSRSREINDLFCDIQLAIKELDDEKREANRFKATKVRILDPRPASRAKQLGEEINAIHVDLH